jgi:hypothetical protein
MAADSDCESAKEELPVDTPQEPVNAFDLSPEQQDTSSLLDRLFGKAVADRYVDFCRLAAGAFSLKVPLPIAAHALRELESMLRDVLAVPMDAKTPNKPENADKIAEARRFLKGLGCFDDDALDRATNGLKPRYNHKAQIRKIATRLGLDPEGDITHRWTSLCDSFGKAHQRAFHRSLEVDDEFRTKYQEPFDTVIRAVASALEGRYTALMRRVEAIAAMPNRAEAVAAFAREIPGALPLQWHFFKSLRTSDWLPQLARESLLGEPYALPEESGSSFRTGSGPREITCCEWRKAPMRRRACSSPRRCAKWRRLSTPTFIATVSRSLPLCRRKKPRRWPISRLHG